MTEIRERFSLEFRNRFSAVTENEEQDTEKPCIRINLRTSTIKEFKIYTA